MGRHVHDNAPAIRFLRERGIRSVRGNHDQVIINKHLFDYQDPEDREYLTTMPLDLEVTVCGITIRIFHATPHDLEEVVLDDTPDRTLAKTFEAHPADLYILGHSHKAFSREIGARRFVGPGYLGDVGGNPTFCVFTPCDSIRIETLPSAY